MKLKAISGVYLKAWRGLDMDLTEKERVWLPSGSELALKRYEDPGGIYYKVFLRDPQGEENKKTWYVQKDYVEILET